jgi:transmembrane sensor
MKRNQKTLLRGALLSGALFLTLLANGCSSPSSPSAEGAAPGPVQSYSTERGAQQHFTLADGSELQMNVVTKLEARFAPGQRELQLYEGEARVQIQPSGTPFIVRVGGWKFEVVDTLNMRYRYGVTEVQPVSSIVSAKNKAGVQKLPQTQGAGLLRLSPEKPPEVINLAAAKLAWLKREIDATDMRVIDVLREFNLYNAKLQIDLPDRRANDVIVGGHFNLDDPRGWVNSLAQYNFSFTEANNQLVLTYHGEVHDPALTPLRKDQPAQTGS